MGRVERESGREWKGRKKSTSRIVGSGIDISKQNCVTAKCGLCCCTTKTPFSHYCFFALLTDKTTGFPWWLRSKESACQCRRRIFDPWPRKIPWRRKQWPTPIFLPGKCLGQRSPAGLQSMGSQRAGHSLATEQQQQQAEHGLLWHPCFSIQTWLKSKKSECAINCEWLSWKNKNHFHILSMNGKWHGNVWWVVVGMGGGMLNN